MFYIPLAQFECHKQPAKVRDVADVVKQGQMQSYSSIEWSLMLWRCTVVSALLNKTTANSSSH